ncbi:hypothetical protein E5D57_011380 [Metarhizium anisopliae]|nr:hypothetical protein E5D57_011380 [Metarhizium anisopliae]
MDHGRHFGDPSQPAAGRLAACEIQLMELICAKPWDPFFAGRPWGVDPGTLLSSSLLVCYNGTELVVWGE